MTEQETNVQGDCLNMSECGIYENGTSMVPLRPLMINSRKRPMKLTWIPGCSDFECISDQSQPNLSIGRCEGPIISQRMLQGMSPYLRTGLAAALLVSGGGGGNCCSRTMVRLSNGCVRIN